jgi:hypothetical protein
VFAWLRAGDKVVVIACDDFPEYIGKSGEILGVGDPNKPTAYGVMLDGNVVCFSAHELKRADGAQN